MITVSDDEWNKFVRNADITTMLEQVNTKWFAAERLDNVIRGWIAKTQFERDLENYMVRKQENDAQ